MAEMKLWLLERVRDEDRDEDWGERWDEHLGFVVRASDAEAARCEALVAAGVDVEEWMGHDDLGCQEPWWGDPARTTCVEVIADGPAGVVLGSFNAS